MTTENPKGANTDGAAAVACTVLLGQLFSKAFIKSVHEFCESLRKGTARLCINAQPGHSCVWFLMGLIVFENGAQANPFLRGDEVMHPVSCDGHRLDALLKENVLVSIVQTGRARGERVNAGLLGCQHGKEILSGLASLGFNLRPFAQIIPQERANDPADGSDTKQPQCVRWYLSPLGIYAIGQVILSWVGGLSVGWIIGSNWPNK